MNHPNSVDVDEVAIDATLAGLAGADESPAPDAERIPESAAEQVLRMNVDWSQALDGAMQLFAKVVAPNWRLTADEQALLIEQGSQTLEAFFPNLVLEGKWLALASFGLCTGTVMMKRFDPDTVSFAPMRMRTAEPVAPATDAAAAAAAAQPGGDNVVRVVAPAWVGKGM